MKDVKITPGNPDCNVVAHDTHAQPNEKVTWHNNTQEDVDIEFVNDTPFDVASFTIPAMGNEQKTIKEDAEEKRYDFQASCNVGPPGPPGIIVDPPN